MSSEPKLCSSSDYGLFQVSEFNRDIRSIKKLLASMKKHRFIPAFPLHVQAVGGKLLIKSGHHRFEAAKQLGLPVFYVVSDDVATIPELEQSTLRWRLDDYVHCHARSGSAPYIALVDFSERTGIVIAQSASLLWGEAASSQNMADRLKTGRYEIRETEHAEKVGQVVIALRGFNIKQASKRGMVSALCAACWVKEFDVDWFINRAERFPHMFVNASRMDEFLDMIDKVYNHCNHNKKPIAFMARAVMKDRKKTAKLEHFVSLKHPKAI